MRVNVRGKHAVVTGGSTGIGFSIAKCLVEQGANVTILARSVSKLEEALKALQQHAEASKSGSKVGFQSADVTNYEQVCQAVKQAEEEQGPLYMLVCNAGAASPGYIHELDIGVYEQSMQLNYMGSVKAIKATVDGMVKRGSGHICIVSSAMGTMGFIGYTSYAPTKYALRGLADCLRNELQGTGVSVSLAFPPDTDTPGFANENKTKPPETIAISSGSSVFPPGKVARVIVDSILRGAYICGTPDLGLAFHNRSQSGMVPRSFPSILLDMLVGFTAPIVHLVFSRSMDSVSQKGAKRRYAKLLGEADAADM